LPHSGQGVQVRQLASASLAIGLWFLLVLVASAAGSTRGVRSGSSRGWTRTGLGAVSQRRGEPQWVTDIEVVSDVSHLADAPTEQSSR
jgi:hypothetical protein